MNKKLKKVTAMLLLLGVVVAFNAVGPKKVSAAQPYIGEIRLVALSYAPAGWEFCEGQLLSIDEYEALFQLIGTTYGGDGVSTFALPDLRGRIPIGAGQGTGLSNYVFKQKGGTETVTLTTNNMPAHTHALKAISSPGNTATPGSTMYLAKPQTPDRQEIDIYASGTADTQLNNNSISPSGVGQAININITKPYLGLHYIISLFGIYPSPT